MSTRPRLNNIFEKMNEPEEQVTPPVEELSTPKDEFPRIPKSANPKTAKRVFGKAGKRQIVQKGGEVIEVDRPYGQRGDFDKVTVTLPREVRMLLIDESTKRKREGSREWAIAAILRELIVAGLSAKS